MTRFDLLASTAMPTTRVPEAVPVSRFDMLYLQSASRTEGMVKSRYGHQAKVQAMSADIVRKPRRIAHEPVDLVFWEKNVEEVNDLILSRYPHVADRGLAEPLTNQILCGPIGAPNASEIMAELQSLSRIMGPVPMPYIPETAPIVRQDNVRRLIDLVESTLWQSPYEKLFRFDSVPESPTYDAKAYRDDRSRGTKSSL